MDGLPAPYQSLAERMAMVWQRALRFFMRVGIAFGLSTAAGIGIGAAVTDNGLVQIAVTVLAAFGFWLPFLFLVTRAERYFKRRHKRRMERAVPAGHASEPDEEGWSRLAALAPDQSDRLSTLKRSLDESRRLLGHADLDPDAHDLCVLIDRRLPELIRSELESLPPDDRHRRRQIGELVDLIEQFARHCSRSRADAVDSGFEAAVLRRRFEARLSDRLSGDSATASSALRADHSP